MAERMSPMKGANKMKKTYLAFLMTVLAVLLFGGVVVYSDSTDERIVNSIRNSYVFKVLLAGDDIQIQSEEGDVVLSGTVPDEYHKQLAEDTAAGMPDVFTVTNNLAVRDDFRLFGTDSLLLAKIKAALLFHKNTNVIKTEVHVADGVVTLRGEADNQAQKDLTTEYVRDIEGVKQVVNEMSVPGPPAWKHTGKRTVGRVIDDASIVAQLKMSLLFHKSTSALRTRVESRNGVVSLYGKANSQAEKEMVTRLALDVKGVRKVKNRMAVE